MTPTANVSVIAPVNPAIEYMKQVLLRPFNLTKWFVIGFGAWLAGLTIGEVLDAGFDHFSGIHPNIEDLPGQLQRAKALVLDDLGRLESWAIYLAAAGLVLWVLLSWIRSRGRFVFLHCVALNRAEVSAPWKKFARAGNSLFKFQLVVGLLGMAVNLPLLIWAGLLVHGMIAQGAPTLGGVFLVIGLALACLVVASVPSLVMMFTEDFVAPIMFLRDCTCLEGWRELRGLMSGNLDLFVLYVLFQIVLGVAILILVVVCVILTCCVAGKLLSIPYVGSVLLLPVSVFRRSYSALYFAQFGPDYNVFPAPPSPPPLPA